MAKRGRKGNSGEQGTLIDTGPKESKKIIAAARKYKSVSAQRQALTAEEVAAKKDLLDLVKQENLQMVDGKIQFEVDGLTITVTPRDELIRVKEKGDSEETD